MHFLMLYVLFLVPLELNRVGRLLYILLPVLVELVASTDGVPLPRSYWPSLVARGSQILVGKLRF